MASEETKTEKKTLHEDSSDSESAEPSGGSEEAIFSLLFKQCDKDSSGLVKVDVLVDFIQSVQMGSGGREGEQEYDSHVDVPKLQYNLHLLKAMLDCNAIEGQVDQGTYSHIIKMWVKDVRGRSHSISSPPSPPLEVSQLSDSEPATEDWSYSEHSLEASGGPSSQQSFDRLELLNTVADLRLENKRLNERNRALAVQMEGSEENLKELQSHNLQLQQEAKSTAATVIRVTELERENTELLVVTGQLKQKVTESSSRIEELERQLTDMQEELSLVTTQLTNADTDREGVEEENRAYQRLLEQKEEMLNRQESKEQELEAQLNELQQHHSVLSQTIADLNEVNENLKTENADLQARPLLRGTPASFPLSSTPHTHRAPSWHDELSAHDSLLNTSSPIRGTSEMKMDSESFSKLVQETSIKFNSTTNKMVREITEMMNQSSPIPSRHTGDSTHTITSTERINERSFHAFESKLSEILRQKKQLQNENMELLVTIEELRAKLAELRQQPSQEMATQVSPIATQESSVQTGPLQTEVIRVEPQMETEHVISFPAELFQPDESSLVSSPPHPRPTLSRSTLTSHSIEAVDFDHQLEPDPVSENSDRIAEEPAHMMEAPGHMTGVPSHVTEEPNHIIEEPGHMTEEPGHMTEEPNHMIEEPGHMTETSGHMAGVPVRLVGEPVHTIKPSHMTGAPGHITGTSEHSITEEPDYVDEGEVLRRRQEELMNQCEQLETRASQLESARQSSCSRIGSAVVQILKGVTFALCLSLLVMLLLIAIVVCYDKLDVCGPYCRHSPLATLYSMFNPHWQYRSIYTPI